jgi:hypothetical protein
MNLTTGWTTEVRLPAGSGIFLIVTASRPALESTQSPIQRVPEVLSQGINLPRRETDQSPPCSSEVTNAWSYMCPLQCLHYVAAKYRGFTFYIYHSEDKRVQME